MAVHFVEEQGLEDTLYYRHRTLLECWFCLELLRCAKHAEKDSNPCRLNLHTTVSTLFSGTVPSFEFFNSHSFVSFFISKREYDFTRLPGRVF